MITQHSWGSTLLPITRLGLNFLCMGRYVQPAMNALGHKVEEYDLMRLQANSRQYQLGDTSQRI
jgi:hypothetical protein